MKQNKYKKKRKEKRIKKSHKKYLVKVYAYLVNISNARRLYSCP